MSLRFAVLVAAVSAAKPDAGTVRADGGASVSRDAGVALRPDDASVVRDLELLEQLDLLKHLDVLE